MKPHHLKLFRQRYLLTTTFQIDFLFYRISRADWLKMERGVKPIPLQAARDIRAAAKKFDRALARRKRQCPHCDTLLPKGRRNDWPCIECGRDVRATYETQIKLIIRDWAEERKNEKIIILG